MSARSRVTPQQVSAELDPDYFRPYQEDISAVLVALDQGAPFERQIELAGRSLKAFWQNYAQEHVARVLDSFPRVQRALFGLEEDPQGGRRYRDHYVHAFDVFITGSRIISQILAQLEEPSREGFMKEAFKVTPEPETVPFPRIYTAARRLFFLWTLTATFHDVGIPVEHLDNIRQGLNGFLSYFGLRLAELYLDQKSGVGTQLPTYFDLMARFYPWGIVPNAGRLYDRPPKGSPYLYQALADAYGENDHGVISAVCLFNSFKETFLVGHHKQPEYDLTPEQYRAFVELILEQDVARAALAIALHSFDLERYPKLFPIDFRKLPLTFLLILCDELQEAFRLEGITFVGITKLTEFPEIRVELLPPPALARIEIICQYVSLKPEEERLVLDSTASWAQRHGVAVPARYPEFLSWLWDRIAGSLRRKLRLEACPLQLRVAVYLEQPGRRQRRMIFEQELGA